MQVNGVIMILQYFGGDGYSIESKDGIKYLFPLKEYKIIIDGLSFIYVDDVGSCFVDSSFNRTDIVIVPISKDLNFLDLILDYCPKIILLRNYGTKNNSKSGLKLSEVLLDLSKRGLIKFTMNPCMLSLPKYSPEIWIFCVDGDTPEYILKGDRDYSI